MAERIASAIDRQGDLRRRGGDRHRQDLRAYLDPARRPAAGDRLHRHQDAAGPALHQDIPTVIGGPGRATGWRPAREGQLSAYHLEYAPADGRFLTREDAADARRVAVFAKITRERQGPNAGTFRKNYSGGMRPPRPGKLSRQDCPQGRGLFRSGPTRALRRRPGGGEPSPFSPTSCCDEGMAELLPACNTVIFDEAHQLPEVATLFFGDSVSSAQVLDLARDARTEGLLNARRPCRFCQPQTGKGGHDPVAGAGVRAFMPRRNSDTRAEFRAGRRLKRRTGGVRGASKPGRPRDWRNAGGGR